MEGVAARHAMAAKPMAPITSIGKPSPNATPPSRRRNGKSSTSKTRPSTTLYNETNRIERFLSIIKHFRRIATRYDKLAATFMSFINLAATIRWLKYLNAYSRPVRRTTTVQKPPGKALRGG